MKKTLLILILLTTINCAIASNSIKIPSDILNVVTKTVETNIDAGFFQKLFIKQLINNASVNGTKLKDLKNLDTVNLIDAFTVSGVFKKVSDNVLIEPNTGATLTFTTYEDCIQNKCTIILDFNGDEPPNELWTKPDEINDRVEFTVETLEDGGLKIKLPDFI